MKISVIIPVCNSAKTIRRCIACVLASTYHDFELICSVAESSKDESLSIISEISRQDNRVTFLINKHNWPASGRNAGVKKAVGEVILFIDSDLFIFPETMNLFFARLSGGKCGAVGGRIEAQKMESICEDFEQYRMDRHYSNIRHMELIPTSNMMMYKTVLEQVSGFDERFRFAEDFDLCLRLIDAGYNIVYDSGITVCHAHQASWKGMLQRAFGYAQGGAYLSTKYSKTYLAQKVPFQYFPTPILGTFVKYPPRLWLIGLIYNITFTLGGVWGFFISRKIKPFIPLKQCGSCR